MDGEEPGGGLSAAERAVIERGRAWIRDHEEQLVGLLAALVGRQSVTGTEGTHDDPETTVGALYEFLTEETTRATLTARPVEPGRENCHAVLEGTGEELFVCTSHTDTVATGQSSDWPDGEPCNLSSGTVRRVDPGTVALTVDGHTERRTVRDAYDEVWTRREEEQRAALVGRGAFDNKASIVCLAGALLALEQGLDGTELGGTLVHGHLVGEEVSQVGAKAFAGWGDRDGWLGSRFPDPEGAVVVLDGSYGFVPAVGHRGLAWVTLRAEGESTHAATPHLGENAVLRVATALAATDSDAFRERIGAPFVEDRLLGELTVAAGTTIVGGDVTRDDEGQIGRAGVNAVPDWCETTFDVRFPRWEGYPDGVDEIREQFEEAVEAHADATDDRGSVTATVDPAEFFPPVAIAESRPSAREHPLVARALAATESTVGYDPGVTVAPGVTDAAAIHPATGLPTLVEYGPAGGFSHEPWEFVERDSVVEGAAIMLELSVRQLGLA
ncbi:MAG: peptidase M20 family protein [halophilic archaeon J07HX64]|jgi:Acetylornithine deacetylase/Succinyl-diaminopimelate desuccinylase and related deacylases|nr:MAG: peptidase M20 family protein [halophilic archaeon J07HX64]